MNKTNPINSIANQLLIFHYQSYRHPHVLINRMIYMIKSLICLIKITFKNIIFTGDLGQIKIKPGAGYG